MAGFLDNSGDIILDAVITDVGRKRLSEGRFRIDKFALGDDEIQYNLYNKNHPSGSAYYDLEILQSPVFQGMTQANANINYGLMTLTNQNLLYLPTIVENQKLTAAERNLSLNTGSNSGLFTVCVNDQTYNTLVTTDSQSSRIYTTAGLDSAKGITLESGLNTTDLKGSPPNQNTYIIAEGLQDLGFSVYCDARFINMVLGPAAQGNKFATTGGGAASVTWAPFVKLPAVQSTLQLTNYNTYNIAGLPNGVYYQPGQTTADTATSALAGPRGSATILSFDVDGSLSNLSWNWKR